MSIRLRMTLLYSTILALTLIAFSVVLYTIQSRYTLHILENDLAESAQQITLGLVRFLRDLGRSRAPMGPFRLNPPELPMQELAQVRTRDTFRLLNAAGVALDLTGTQEGEALPLSQEGLAQVRQDRVVVEIASVEGERWLIYNQPITIAGETIGIVQVARALTDRDRILQALRVTLAGSSLLTTAVAFGMGWLLSGVVLQPIHRITRTARAIGQERDFAQRVQYRGPNDELGQLATTFNAMLSRLQEAFQQVAHALQVQRDFGADVSHELRTPLTTIRGNLALLGHDPPLPRDEQEDVVVDMIDETERLIRLVNDLLTLTRADAGRKLNREPVPVKALLEDVCRQARVLEPQREIECQGENNLLALADRDALKQVLLILLDNALKHTGGPIHVTLGDRDLLVAISVRDEGPGMSPELRERAFDRCYRGDKSRSTPGFGLGLSIAKALVEAQEGTIEVESEVRKGSTFTVLLPVTRVSA
jgi:two-component system OmpR family sensor kinase